MKNPWLKIKDKGPYVLESDRKQIDEFNKKVSEDLKIRKELLPEPFIGNINADIILLNLNPGFEENDINLHKQNFFKKLALGNLHQKNKEYPFFYLNPELEATSGYRWWDKKLSYLIREFGRENVAKNVCCFEFFPYHSKKFKPMPGHLPSQEYTFHLVRQAMERNAKIIFLRAERFWLNAIPELKKYNYYFLKNPQSSNLKPESILKNQKKKYFNEAFKGLYK